MEKVSDKDKEILKNSDIVPGVFVSTQSLEFDMSGLDAIRDKLKIDSCDPMDFNSYMHIAQVVAEHYKLDNVVADIQRYYNIFAGKPILIRSIIIFWMFILQRYRK